MPSSRMNPTAAALAARSLEVVPSFLGAEAVPPSAAAEVVVVGAAAAG